MHTHLLRCRATCYDLTVYALSYIYFLENIHPQALGSICYVMNLSSSPVIERQQLFQKSFLEILNQKDPSKTKPNYGGGRSSEHRPRLLRAMKSTWLIPEEFCCSKRQLIFLLSTAEILLSNTSWWHLNITQYQPTDVFSLLHVTKGFPNTFRLATRMLNKSKPGNTANGGYFRWGAGCVGSYVRQLAEVAAVCPSAVAAICHSSLLSFPFKSTLLPGLTREGLQHTRHLLWLNTA